MEGVENVLRGTPLSGCWENTRQASKPLAERLVIYKLVSGVAVCGC